MLKAGGSVKISLRGIEIYEMGQFRPEDYDRRHDLTTIIIFAIATFDGVILDMGKRLTYKFGYVSSL